MKRLLYQRRLIQRRVGCALLLSTTLVACSDAGDSQPSPLDRTLTTWTIAPDFSVAEIEDATTRAWYEQISVEIANEKTVQCPPLATPLEDYERYPASGTKAACSALKHFVGRGLNFYVTALLSNFRLTGDRNLLEEVDRVMEVAYSRLRDTDGDGYKNWAYLLEYGSNDFNLKEDSLAHGFIAEVAYVFKKNAALSTAEHDYGKRAEQWTTYLRQNFEPKWAPRESTQTTQGLPVMQLFHPFIEMLRYTVYMAKLFPEEARYRTLHERLAKIALAEFKTDPTPKGDSFVWSHVVRQVAKKGNGDPNFCLHFQMGTYPQQTMTVFMDLALEGYPGFADKVALQKLSRTLSESILEPNPMAFLYKDVGGERNGIYSAEERKTTVVEGWCFSDAPYSASSAPADNFRSEGSYALLPWGFLAAFAPEADTEVESSEIYQVNERAYGNPAVAEIPAQSMAIPAAQAFSRLFIEGSFELAVKLE